MPVAEETAKPTEGKSTGTEAEPTGEAQGGATPESDPAKGKMPDQTIPEGGVVIDTSDVPGTTGANLPESNPKPEGGSSASDQTTVVHPPQPEGSTHQEGSGALNDESTSPQPPHPEDQNQAGKSTVLDAESAAEAQFDSDTVEDIDFDALESEDSDSDSDSSIEKFGDFDIEPDSDLHDYLDSEIDPAIAASTRFSKGLTAEERTTLLKKFKQVDDEARLVKEASAKYTESEKVKFKDKQEPYSPILIHYERKSLASSFSSKFRLKANIQTFEAIALRSYGSWGLIVNRACRRPLGPRVEFEAARKQYLTFINDIHFMVRDPEKLTLNDYNRVLSKLNIATNSKDPAVKMRMKTELEIFDTAKFMVADNEERISSAAVSFIDGLIEKYSGYFESNDFLYRVSRAEKGVYASDAELASRGMDAAKQIRVGDVVYESALISTSADSLSAMFKYSAVELGGKGATNYLPEKKKKIGRAHV